MNEYFEKLKPYFEKGMALTTALNLLEWDTETLAPIESGSYTGKVVGILSDEYFHVYNNKEVKKLLEKLQTQKEQENLSEIEQAVVKQLGKLYEELEGIPPKEYREYKELLAESVSIWSKAKEKNQFEQFAPVLEKIIDYKKRFASYHKKGKENLYDILLEEFEPGFTVEKLDAFFEQIKEKLIPLIKKVSVSQESIDKSYNYQFFEVEKQKEFCRWIAGYVGFDYNRGVIGESAHPFTNNLHNHDVRITNHYYENNLESGIFSIIHETGHALYEMGIPDELTQTLVGSGASMGMHESQSRFFENIIGKSESFWKPIYPKLVELFREELKSVSLKEFIQGIRKSVPSVIRTEADELTYPIHILIRYEIEKMIMEKKIHTKDLPAIWNQKYKEYLGIEPKNEKEGILQDVHWAAGDFGYFPSYGIGSAVAAQIYYHMKSIMPLEQYLEEGNLTPIREYLRDTVHKYGMRKETNEILQNMMGEDLNPDYYIQYLMEKYDDIK